MRLLRRQAPAPVDPFFEEYGEGGALARRGGRLDARAEELGRLPAKREAQPHALGVFVRDALLLREGLEQVTARLLGEALTVVGHGQEVAASLDRRPHDHLAACAREPDGVAGELLEDDAQQVRVRAERRETGAHLGAEPHAALARLLRGLVERRRDLRGDVHVGRLGGLTAAGEIGVFEQVPDRVRVAPEHRVERRHHLRRAGGPLAHGAAEQLGLDLHGRDRGPELVRDEVQQVGLDRAGLLGADLRLARVVEGLGEIAGARAELRREGGDVALAALDLPAQHVPRALRLDEALQAGEELRRGERLHDVVLRARFEQADPPRVVRAGRQDEDGDLCCHRLGAEVADEVFTALPRHHHVGHDRGRGSRPRDSRARLRRRRPPTRSGSRRERVADEAAHVRGCPRRPARVGRSPAPRSGGVGRCIALASSIHEPARA